MGLALSIVMGGTKVLVEKVKFNGGAHFTIEKKVIRPISERLRRSSSDDLFGFVADCVKEVNPENGIKAGFVFSYPCILTSLKRGTLVEWTKDIRIEECKGKDPCVLLQEQLDRRNLNVKIVALCNDSVSTLVSHSYSHSRTAVGVILGSGTNAAYVERISNIPKLHSEIASQFMIINMEWGALGCLNPSVLPFSSLDIEIDKNSINPGKQLLEKMMSGLFLGELVRCWIVQLHNKGDLLSKADLSNRLFMERLGFDSVFCTTILLDDSEDLTEVSSILESFGIHQSTQKDRKQIREIVDCVITRSARLMGACLFTVLQHMQEYGMGGGIGVDGSVYKYVPGYKARMIRAMKELGMDNVECGIAEDGSSVGAALIGYYSSTLWM